MVKAFLHVNGVDYELATPLAEPQVQQLVERIASAADPVQRVTVKQGRVDVTLVIKTALVWSVSGWVKTPGQAVVV